VPLGIWRPLFHPLGISFGSRSARSSAGGAIGWPSRRPSGAGTIHAVSFTGTIPLIFPDIPAVLAPYPRCRHGYHLADDAGEREDRPNSPGARRRIVMANDRKPVQPPLPQRQPDRPRACPCRAVWRSSGDDPMRHMVIATRMAARDIGCATPNPESAPGSPGWCDSSRMRQSLNHHDRGS
jgi:hypothetical protein